MIVEVWDAASPDVRTSTVVSISVRRNEFAPVFVNNNMQVQVSEHVSVGEVVAKVNASDEDLPVRVIFKRAHLDVNSVVFYGNCFSGTEKSHHVQRHR